MRLSSLELLARKLPALGALPPRVGLLVRASADGTFGLGEGTAMPGHSPDPSFGAGDVGAELARLLSALPGLVGELPLGLPEPGEAIGEALGKALDEAPAPGAAEYPALRFALEAALLDLTGRRLGRPASALFGGALRAPVPVNALLRADEEDLAARGARSVASGYRCLKVKLRARDDDGFARELARLVALRRTVGDGVELRLDANAAWNLDEARRRLEALAAVAPSFVEQPVPARDLSRLGVAAVPFAADESLALEELWPELLEAPGCAAFVLKPAVLGGFSRALGLGRRAAARGLGVVVTHLFDGPSGLAAACELALALSSPPRASGLDLHAGLAAWPPARVPQRRERLEVLPADAPGLGLLAEDRRALLEGAAPVAAGQGRA